MIEAGGGTLLKLDNWGKRKLAYEVKKQLKGIYLFFSYLGTGRAWSRRSSATCA